MPEATSFAELIFETLSGAFKKRDEVHHHHEFAFLTITINEFIRQPQETTEFIGKATSLKTIYLKNTCLATNSGNILEFASLG